MRELEAVAGGAVALGVELVHHVVGFRLTKR
jgi:hypothetical protein